MTAKASVLLQMSRTRAKELGLLTCACGHPANNHFSRPNNGCAHCNCTGYSERSRAGTVMVSITDLPDLQVAQAAVRAIGLICEETHREAVQLAEAFLAQSGDVSVPYLTKAQTVRALSLAKAVLARNPK